MEITFDKPRKRIEIVNRELASEFPHMTEGNRSYAGICKCGDLIRKECHVVSVKGKIVHKDCV